MFSQTTWQIVFNALHRYSFAKAFPVDSTATYAEIVSKVGLAEEDTRRLIRVAMTDRIFKEPIRGTVAHTALSRAVAEIPVLSQYMGLATEEVGWVASRLVEAITKWPGSEEPSETGYNIACNLPGIPYWEGIKGDAHRAARFEDTMKFTHQGAGYDRAAMVELYD